MTLPMADAQNFGIPLQRDTVRFERLLPGPIERVWSFLVDSEKRGQWLAQGSMPVTVGESFELHFDNSRLSSRTSPVPEAFQRYDRPRTSQHRLTRFDPPHALSFSWGSEEAPSEVSIDLSAVGDRVRLVLVHTRLPERGSVLMVSGGWHTHLDVLAQRLAGQEPGAFWTAFAEVHREYDRRLPPA